MKRLNSFAAVDDQGALHISIPDLLKIMDVADTPANSAEAERLAKEYFQETLPAAALEVAD